VSNNNKPTAIAVGFVFYNAAIFLLKKSLNLLVVSPRWCERLARSFEVKKPRILRG